jgi:general secretion pathway protein H
LRRQRGLSLLELTLVIALVAAAATVVGLIVQRSLPGPLLRQTARELAAELRETRTRAMLGGRSQRFEIDTRSRAWQGVGDRHGRLPESLRIVAVGARQEQPADGIAAIRFFPDGSATGGRITLVHDTAAWQVDVAWLTGEVELERVPAPP